MKRVVAGLVVATALLAGCTPGASANSPRDILRLGYFPNLTHAGPVYGVGTGTYQRALGATRLIPRLFSAGPSAVEALFSGSLDAAYLGPNPAVNAFVRSHGSAVRVVAGATAGGASLVVRPAISSVAQLRGRTIADPQLGGTQDVALRSFLAARGFREQLSGAGDVKVVSSDNAQTLRSFQSGRVDGAWVPEPWATRMVLEGGGHELVDERSLWPSGQFATTVLVVRPAYLRAFPDRVRHLLEGQVAADDELRSHPEAALRVVNEQLRHLTGKALRDDELTRAFAHLTVTEDPVSATLRTVAGNASALGLVRRAPLEGIEDLRLLDAVLGRPVDEAGLGGTA